MQILVCRSHTTTHAFPLQHVAEVMRPLPIEPSPPTESYASGLSRIRGEHVPVIEATTLLGSGRVSASQRLVLLKAGNHSVAIAVDEVIGVRAVGDDVLRDAPAFAVRCSAAIMADIDATDPSLAIVLRGSRILPKTTGDNRDTGDRRGES